MVLNCTSLFAKPKPRKCAVCRSPFFPRSISHKACSPECGQVVAERQRQKKNRIEAKKQAQETRQKRELMKTRSELMREAQHAFNAFIRARDRIAGHPCISSGKALDWSGNQVDAGHYRSTGAAPHLRFSEDNCHAQSKHDNRYLSGNAIDYRIGLIARIGRERVEALEADNTVRKWTCDDLRQIRDTYRAKLKAMK